MTRQNTQNTRPATRFQNEKGSERTTMSTAMGPSVKYPNPMRKPIACGGFILFMVLFSGCASKPVSNPMPAIVDKTAEITLAAKETHARIIETRLAIEDGEPAIAIEKIDAAEKSSVTVITALTQLKAGEEKASAAFDKLAKEKAKAQQKWAAVQDDWLGPRSWRVIYWTCGISAVIALLLFILGRGAAAGSALAGIIHVAFHIAAAIATFGLSLVGKLIQWLYRKLNPQEGSVNGTPVTA